MTDLNKKSDGFTLVELITAIIISAFFMVAVFTLLTNNSRIAQRTRDLAAANSFAENRIEALRSIGYSGLSFGTTDLTSQLPAELQEPRSASLEVTYHTVSTKHLDLTITYNDQGTAKTYSYSTLVGELGVGR